MNLVTIDTASGNMPLYIGPNNATSVIIGKTQGNVNIEGNVSTNNIITKILDTSSGETLSIGNVNANIVNIGKLGTTINIGGYSYIPGSTTGSTTVLSTGSSGTINGDISNNNISTNNMSAKNILTTNISSNNMSAINVFTTNISSNNMSTVSLIVNSLDTPTTNNILSIGNTNAQTINLGTSTSTIYCDSKIKGTDGNYSFDISTNHIGFNYTNLPTLNTHGYWIQTGTYMLTSVSIGETNRTVSHSVFTPALIAYSGVHYVEIYNESSSPGITFSLNTIANPFTIYTYNPYGISKTNVTFRIIMYCW